jgi:hypothetical protein
MDPVAFDTLARAIAQAGTRRRLLGRLLVGVPLLGALAPGREEALAAERPLERLQRRTPQRNRQQRNNRRRNTNTNNNNNQNTNNKNNNKDQNNGPGTGRPLNCPDGTISCNSDNGLGLCGPVVHTFPSVGHCGQGISCCPCDHPDYGYWVNLCNQTVPECMGKCWVTDDVSLGRCFLCASD